ncbi:MAG: hypothetical protein GY757_17950 [bacterium]|nr:hypothetical protein [bacterium]
MKEKKSIFILVLFFSILLVDCSKKEQENISESGPAQIVGTMTEFSKPGQILVNNDEVYITSGSVIYIYTLKDGKLSFKKQFGKAGTEKGELRTREMYHRGSVTIWSEPDTFLVGSCWKLSLFSKEGEFQKEFAPDMSAFDSISGAKRLGKGYVGIRDAARVNEVHVYYSIFDENLKIQKELLKSRCTWREAYTKIDPTLVFQKEENFYVEDSKIFVMDHSDNKGTIHVFDHNGNKLYEIKHDYMKQEITENSKAAYKDYWYTTDFKPDYCKRFYESRIKKGMWIWPDHFASARKFYVTGKKIYVHTNKRNENNDKFLFYVLQLKGEIIDRVMVPVKYKNLFRLYLSTLHKGKFYQVVPTKDETAWELHVTNIEKNETEKGKKNQENQT